MRQELLQALPCYCSCTQLRTQACPSALLHADLLWLDCVLITKGLHCKCMKSDWKTIIWLAAWGSRRAGSNLIFFDCPCMNFCSKTVDGIACLSQQQSSCYCAMHEGRLFLVWVVGFLWLVFFFQCMKIYISKDRFNLDICFLYTRWQGFHYSILH